MVKRIIVWCISALLGIFVLTCCSNKQKKTVRYISDDDAWYSVQPVHTLDSIDSDYIVSVEDIYVINEDNYMINCCDKEKKISAFLLSDNGNDLKEVELPTGYFLVDVCENEKQYIGLSYSRLGYSLVEIDEKTGNCKKLKNEDPLPELSMPELVGTNGGLFICDVDSAEVVIYKFINKQVEIMFRVPTDKGRYIGCIGRDNGNLLICFQQGNDVLLYNVFSGEATTVSVGETTVEEFFIVNNELVFVQSEKIYRLDEGKKAFVEFFDYNDCDINMYLGINGDILYVDAKTLIIKPLDSDDFFILSLSDSNPYSGRKVLEIASVNGVNGNVACAINRFNKTNSEYKAVYTGRYEWKCFINSDAAIRGLNEMNTLEAEAYNKAAKSLMDDDQKGSGPDILVDSNKIADYCRLYCSDISDQLTIGDDDIINPDTISDSKCVPLCFKIIGLAAPYSEKYTHGITYKEYFDFVSEVCNGESPLYSIGLKNSLLDILFANEFSEISDDVFDSPNMYELIEFITMVDNPIDIDITVSMREIKESSVKQQAVEIGNITDYIKYTEEANLQLYALPSSKDSERLNLEPSTSVSVIDSSINKDASIAFIRSALSVEVQSLIEDSFPVNSEALMAVLVRELQDYNEMIVSEQDSNDSTEGRALYGKTVDETVIDELINLIRSGKMIRNYNEINVILHEELPAVYLGQKSTSDALAIVKKRVQNSLSERN